MENKDISNAYSEVIEVLKTYNDEKIEKLPMEFVELIKSKANPEYKPQILKEVPLEEQNLQEETYSIIAWISQRYWHEKMFEKVYVENDIDADILQYLEVNSNLPIVYQDLNWFEKVKIKIIKIVEKIFRKKKYSVPQEN